MKRYRELTMPEFLRILADDPNRRFAFADTNSTVWREANIRTVSIAPDKSPYVTVHDDGCKESFSRVAEIIEIPDPLIPLKKLEALQELFPEYEWIAMDRNGSACIYSTVAPTPLGDVCMPSSFSPYHKLQAFNGYAKDWETSLIHIPTEIERIKKLEAEA